MCSHYLFNQWLEFELSRKIVFWHSKCYFDIRTESENAIRYSKSYFDSRPMSENAIFIFEILFWHSNWVGKCYFDIQNLFWHSNCFGNRSLTFEILFWQPNRVGKSYFDIQNPILTFELSRIIAFWHSKSYFDIQTESEILFSLRCGILFSRCPSAHPSVRPSVCPSARDTFFLLSWKRSDGYSSISADTLISIRFTHVRKSKG